MRATPPTARSAAAIVLAVACLTVGGCSTATQNDAEVRTLTAMPQIQEVPALADQVPASIRADGLVVATSSNLPPMTFVAPDDHTLVGLDVDVAHAIGSVLGVRTNLATAGFDTIIPGLQSQRYSMALSSLGVTPERLAVVDFVSYYNGGQGFLASAETSMTVAELPDLCGYRVAVQTGSAQQTVLEENQEMCAEAGLPPYSISTFPANDAAVLAISSRRADVMYASISIVDYTAEKSDKFRVAGHYKRAMVGAALAKNSPLTPLVAQAIQHLIRDGTYARLLDKWGLRENAVDQAEVVTSPPTP
ncbi:MAG: ABC transporter substrate-binding protein [Rhodococcus fascians]